MLSRARVLIADDDPQLLDAVSDAFAQLDAQVVRASSGADLIEQLATAGPFDLVVTDISMPWMSGLQAIRSTRAAGLADVGDRHDGSRGSANPRAGEGARRKRRSPAKTVRAERARVRSLDALVGQAI